MIFTENEPNRFIIKIIMDQKLFRRVSVHKTLNAIKTRKKFDTNYKMVKLMLDNQNGPGHI